MKKKKQSIREIVYNFPTTYEIGYTGEDQVKLLEQYFPQFTQEQLSEKIGVVTCTRIDDQFVIYHSDIELALRCLLENRNSNSFEWD